MYKDERRAWERCITARVNPRLDRFFTRPSNIFTTFLGRVTYISFQESIQKPWNRSGDGYRISHSNDRFFRPHRRTGLRLRKIKGAPMNWLYLLSGILAAGIFVYLVIALFYPEKF
jgi:K+-transporting ATPase KdpF subunit